MFYVSDIKGLQTPYTEELFRLRREARLEQVAELDQASEAAELVAGEATAVESSPLSSARGSSAAGSGAGVQPFESTAIGMAGASILSKEAEQAKGSHEAQRSDGKASAKREMLSKEVTGVVPSTRVERERDNTSERSGVFSASHNPYEKLDENVSNRKKALSASQLMSSPVVTLYGDQSVGEALQLFQSRRFRHVPVLSRKKQLVGICSDRDVLRRQDLERQVKDCMTTEVLSARPDTEIREIAAVMFRERIGAMPIISANGDLLGILTRSDILRAVVNKAPLELWV